MKIGILKPVGFGNEFASAQGGVNFFLGFYLRCKQGIFRRRNKQKIIKIKNYKLLKIMNSEIRFLYDIKSVLYDKKWAETSSNFPVYFMYRDIRPQKDEKDDLRQDITIIPSKMLGKEFVKTKGHEHLGKYKEVYFVSKGQAIYLIQKCKKDANSIKVEDVYAVRAKRGESVLIPAGYGHVTINPYKQELRIVNWINRRCKNNYRLFEKKQGGCYYYTKKGWIKNKNYKQIPKLRFEKPLKLSPFKIFLNSNN